MTSHYILFILRLFLFILLDIHNKQYTVVVVVDILLFIGIVVALPLVTYSTIILVYKIKIHIKALLWL